jgi:hypothetical protein
VNGKSAQGLSRDLGLSYKFALKLRDAMAEEMKGGSDGKVAEVDGGYFGGNAKPAIVQAHRRDRRLAGKQSGKRAYREGIGCACHEAASLANSHERFEVKRTNHQEAYSLDGACTNMAEENFFRLRGAEIGIHPHMAGSYFLRYAQESPWREDNRRVSNGDQVNRAAALAVKRGRSVDFTGYWQRHIADGPARPLTGGPKKRNDPR